VTRPAKVVIDPVAAASNMARARAKAGLSKVMAVVKADAYGHGIERMASLFASADSFAVASLEEAVQLRQNGIKKPIVLLEGPFDRREMKEITFHSLEVVVHSMAQIEMLESFPTHLPIWLKCDTGMHRLGFGPEELGAAVRRIRKFAAPLRYMTHFANAHIRGHPTVTRQIEMFRRMIGQDSNECSLANSGALLTNPTALGSWVRPGLMLYGVSPLLGESANELGLSPVMTLRSQLISVRFVNEGEGVGYGGVFRCPEKMQVGVVAYGYGDGYPRNASTGTPILVNGTRTQVIGQCSMDMMTVDLRPVPNANIGDPVTLWGVGLPVEEVSLACDTVPYELLCRARMRAMYELRSP
jgi:alanine racemase